MKSGPLLTALRSVACSSTDTLRIDVSSTKLADVPSTEIAHARPYE